MITQRFPVPEIAHKAKVAVSTSLPAPKSTCPHAAPKLPPTFMALSWPKIFMALPKVAKLRSRGVKSSVRGCDKSQDIEAPMRCIKTQGLCTAYQGLLTTLLAL